MSTESINHYERFLALALAQALTRKGYDVRSEQRLPSGTYLDLVARKPGSSTYLVVELKTAKKSADVRKLASSARAQLRKVLDSRGKGYAVIGLAGTDVAYADPNLLRILGHSSTELALRPLPAPPSDG